MAPSAIVEQNGHHEPYTTNGHKATSAVKLPLDNNGSLDSYEHIDLTPCIGREFPTASLVDIMNAPNSDELLTELALTSMFPSGNQDTASDSIESLAAWSRLVPKARQPHQQSAETTDSENW